MTARFGRLSHAARPETGVVAACAMVLAVLSCSCRLTAAEPPVRAPEAGRNREARALSGRLDQGGSDAERPGALDPIFRVINPAEVQRAFDRAFGLDAGDESPRPRPPEIPEPVFFDVVRPLGDLKYGNELNYLFNSSTRNAPGLQVIEYEYIFADWRSAELDLSYFDGNLEILTPFYQRTLGVSRDGTRVHGYQLSLDDYVRSGFVGGTAVYALGWKPLRGFAVQHPPVRGGEPGPDRRVQPLPAGGEPQRPCVRIVAAAV